MKIGWNLEMILTFFENGHGINFKFIKVFNKVSLLKMLILKIEIFFLIMTIGVAFEHKYTYDRYYYKTSFLITLACVIIGTNHKMHQST